jgi:hypothetical protein
MDAGGAAVTGLTASDFSVEAYYRTASATTHSAYACGATVAEIGGGRYSVAFSLPAVAAHWDVLITPTTSAHTAYDNHLSGVCGAQDVDSLYANVVRTTATLSTSAQLGSQVELTLAYKRWRQFSLTIKDSANNAVNLSGYSNLTLGVRNDKQTTTNAWDSTTAVAFATTGTDGVLTVTIPETASIFGALTAGSASATLYWEITGDVDGDANKTVSIVRSSKLVIVRSEVGHE